MSAVILGMILLVAFPPFAAGISLSGGGSENGLDVTFALVGGDGGLLCR